MTLHPTVPNPYTLLSLLPPRTKVYTCLDLKDASSAYTSPQRHSPSLPLNGKVQSGHQTTAHLDPPPPQGFKNSPAISGKALASDLDSLHSEEYGCWLLQYVDDLLLAAETKEKCWEGMNAVLQLPMETGYRGSKKKAHIWKEEARYLGFVLKRAQGY